MDKYSWIAEHTAGRVLQARICALPLRMADQETRQDKHQGFFHLIHHTQRDILLALPLDTGSRDSDDPGYRRSHHVPICGRKDQIYHADTLLRTALMIIDGKHRRDGKRKILLYTEEIHLFLKFRCRSASETDRTAKPASIVGDRVMRISR